MVNVGEYKKGQGNWLRADDVQVGDHLLILDGGWFDEETFQDKDGKPRLYFCANMRLLRTGVDKKVRLGSENVARITEKFGDDTATWQNRQIVVDEVKTYKGLGKKGVIFKPVETTESSIPKTAPSTLAPMTPGQEPIMSRGEALERSKNWPTEDRNAWLSYLQSHGKLKD